jgi:hypothetical protein
MELEETVVAATATAAPLSTRFVFEKYFFLT